jgi:hypothetical protein
MPAEGEEIEMNNETAPVNVSAVMDTVDALLHSLKMYPDTKAMHISRFTQARDAVAEYIAANEEYDAARRANAYTPCVKNNDRVKAAAVRRDAIHARMKGETK